MARKTEKHLNLLIEIYQNTLKEAEHQIRHTEEARQRQVDDWNAQIAAWNEFIGEHNLLLSDHEALTAKHEQVEKAAAGRLRAILELKAELLSARNTIKQQDASLGGQELRIKAALEREKVLQRAYETAKQANMIHAYQGGFPSGAKNLDQAGVGYYIRQELDQKVKAAENQAQRLLVENNSLRHRLAESSNTIDAKNTYMVDLEQQIADLREAVTQKENELERGRKGDWHSI